MEQFWPVVKSFLGVVPSMTQARDALATVSAHIAMQIGLKNVVCRHERAEDEKEHVEFVLSRGVMPLPDLCAIANRMIDHKVQRNAYPNGVICLKGGDLGAETAKFRKVTEINEISKYSFTYRYDERKVL